MYILNIWYKLESVQVKSLQKSLEYSLFKMYFTLQFVERDISIRLLNDYRMPKKDRKLKKYIFYDRDVCKQILVSTNVFFALYFESNYNMFILIHVSFQPNMDHCSLLRSREGALTVLGAVYSSSPLSLRQPEFTPGLGCINGKRQEWELRDTHLCNNAGPLFGFYWALVLHIPT